MRYAFRAAVMLPTLVPLAQMAAQEATARAPLDRLVAIVERATPEALARHDAPGAAVAIVHRGEVAWSKGFGWADVERRVPVSAQTVFETASLSKPLTAWAVLKLAEERRLDLDAPIDRVLTRWKLPPSEFDRAGVTLRRILAHAAGLSGGGDPGVEPGDRVPTLLEILNGAGYEGGVLHVASRPGEAYRYSSKGYSLLELAIEEASGMRFADYMRREILDPLGLTTSSFGWTPGLRALGATGYDWYGHPLPIYAHATLAQGGWVATASDVARFIAATMQGPNGEPPGRGVVSPESIEAAYTPVPLTNDASLIGLGYNLYTSSGTLVARKTGDHRGWKAVLFAVPKMGAGIVILSNSDRAAAGVFADIACPWSTALGGDPLRDVCKQLYGIRNAQLGIAAGLFFIVLALSAWIAAGLRSGRRRWEWTVTPGRMVRIGLMTTMAVAWWTFWYTDIVMTRLHFAPTSVAVRLDPWPTVFVWVSWSLTLLLLGVTVAGFAPVRKNHASAASQCPDRPAVAGDSPG